MLGTSVDPTLLETQVSYRGGNESTWDEQRWIEISIDQEDAAADTLTAYTNPRYKMPDETFSY